MTDGRLTLWLRDVDLGRMYDGPTAAPIAGLRAVPTAVTIAGVTARVAINLNRDFQPICPPDGQPMTAIVRVFAEPAALPTMVRAERMCAMYRDEAWVAPLFEEFPKARSASGFEAVARHGPKWAPGELVDVAVQLRDEVGQEHLVRASGQLIQSSM